MNEHLKDVYYANRQLIWDLWKKHNIKGTMYWEDFERELVENEEFRIDFLEATTDSLFGKRKRSGGAKDRTKGKNNDGQGIMNVFDRNNENSEEKQGLLAGWRERKGTGTDPTGGRTPGRFGKLLNTVGGLATGYLANRNQEETDTTTDTPPPPPAEESNNNMFLIGGIVLIVVIAVIVLLQKK